MNTLEEKCALLAQTPQSRWYDLRFKPTVMMLLNMNETGEISLREMHAPVFERMNIHIHVFKYDGEFYFLFIEHKQEENIYECFHLERTNSSWGIDLVTSHIVISSDDDKHQETYVPSLAFSMGVNSNSEFISKLNSMF